MNRVSSRAGTFGAILVAVILSLFASSARADEPVPAGPAPASPASPVAPSQAKPKMTAAELEARLLDPSNRGAAIAMAGLKYATALAGVVFLILRLVLRGDERRGLAPRSRPDAVPPRAFRLEAAIPLSLFAALGGSIVVLPIYIALYGTGGLHDLPLEVLFGATAAGMAPVAILAALAIRRGWAVRRVADPAEVFGDDTAPDALDVAFLPRAPWPAAPRWREGMIAFLVASAVVLFVSFVTAIVMSLAGVPPEPQDLVLRVIEPRASHEPWLIAAFGVLIAPITEEYVFRGLLYPAIRDRSTRFVGALVSSALFGLVHMSWTAGPALFCLAMLLCWLYERTGSVWPGILVHVLINATSLLPLFLL